MSNEALIPEAVKMALPLVKELEGFRPAWYLCPAGKRTIGYGETAYAGDAIAEPDAAELLAKRLRRLLADTIVPAVRVPLAPRQLAALASWTYNVGAGAFRFSTLLLVLNQGRYAAVPDELRRWNKLTRGGSILISAGLTARRGREAALWLGNA